jgi:hypothetical protein
MEKEKKHAYICQRKMIKPGEVEKNIPEQSFPFRKTHAPISLFSAYRNK